MKIPKTLQGIIDLLFGNFISLELDINNELRPLVKLVVPSNWIINTNDKFIIKNSSQLNNNSQILVFTTTDNEITIDELFFFIYNDIKKYNENLGDKITKLKEKIDAIKIKEEEKINKLKEKYIGNTNIPILEKPIVEKTETVINNVYIQPKENNIIEFEDDSIEYKPFDDSMLDYPDER